jgi:hypothetical protein
MKLARFIPPELSFLKSLARMYFLEMSEANSQGREAIFIFPSRRAGLYFRYYLSLERKNFVSPRIYAFEDFVDEFASWHNPGSKISFFDQIWEVYQVVREKAKGVPQVQSFEKFIPWGVQLITAFEEVEREGVNLPEYLLTPEGHPVLSEVPLGIVWTAWRERISRMGKTSLGMRYRTCIEKWNEGLLPNFIQDADVHFAGFIRFGSAEKAFLKAVKGNITVWIEATPEDTPDDVKKTLKELRFSFSDLSPQASAKDPLQGVPRDSVTRDALPEIYFYESPDRHHSLEEVGRLIGSVSSPDRPDQVAIIVPDDGVLLPLIYELQESQSQIDVNITMGYPLRRSLAASFVLIWLELLTSRTSDGRFYIPSFLHLIRHPYTRIIIVGRTSASVGKEALFSIETLLQDAGSTYMSCEEIEELIKDATVSSGSVLSVVKDKDLNTENTEKNEKSLEDGQSVLHVFEIIKELLISELLSRSALTFRDVFEVIGKVLEEVSSAGRDKTQCHSEASRGMTTWGYKADLEQAFCKRFIEDIIKPVVQSYWASEPIEHISTAYRFLKETVDVVRVPFLGSPLRGLQVLGFFESNLLSFDEVFILNANEGILPPRRSLNPVLPEGLRRQLGLSTMDDDAVFNRHLFMRLVASARKVHIFYTAMSSTQGSGRRSSLGLTMVRSRFVEELIWKINKQQNSLDEPVIPIPVRIPYRVLKRLDRIEKSPFDSKVRELLKSWLSASFFNSYLKCPVMFFYRYVLGIEEYSGEIEEGLEGRGYAELGVILHETMKRYFSKVGANLCASPEIIVEIFDDVFLNSSLSKRLGRERRFFIRETAIYRLKKYVEWLNERWQPFSVKALEREFYVTLDKKLPLQSDMNINLRGRIDMIALRNDGELWIVDYKSGSRPDLKFSWETLQEIISRGEPMCSPCSGEPVCSPRGEHWDSSLLAELRKCIEDLQLPFYCLIVDLSDFKKEFSDIKALKACYHALGDGRHNKYQADMKENFWDVRPVFEDVLVFLISHIANARAFWATDDLDTCSFCDYTRICPCSAA